MSDGLLERWNDGEAKQAVLDFLKRVTSEGSDFVPIEDRVAAFGKTPNASSPTPPAVRPPSPKRRSAAGRWSA